MPLKASILALCVHPMMIRHGQFINFGNFLAIYPDQILMNKVKVCLLTLSGLAGYVNETFLNSINPFTLSDKIKPPFKGIVGCKLMY